MPVFKRQPPQPVRKPRVLSPGPLQKPPLPLPFFTPKKFLVGKPSPLVSPKKFYDVARTPKTLLAKPETVEEAFIAHLREKRFEYVSPNYIEIIFEFPPIVRRINYMIKKELEREPFIGQPMYGVAGELTKESPIVLQRYAHVKTLDDIKNEIKSFAVHGKQVKLNFGFGFIVGRIGDDNERIELYTPTTGGVNQPMYFHKTFEKDPRLRESRRISFLPIDPLFDLSTPGPEKDPTMNIAADFVFYEAAYRFQTMKELREFADNITLKKIIDRTFQTTSTRAKLIGIYSMYSTITTFYVPLGRSGVVLPQFLYQKKSLWTLNEDNENLCLFAALACHKGKVKRVDRYIEAAREVRTEYNRYMNGFIPKEASNSVLDRVASLLPGTANDICEKLGWSVAQVRGLLTGNPDRFLKDGDIYVKSARRRVAKWIVNPDFVAKSVPCTDGVPLEELEDFEQCFKVGIQIYTVELKGRRYFGTMIRAAPEEYEDIMRVVQYEDHICWISNVEDFLDSHICAVCGKGFRYECELKKHECAKITDVFDKNPTIWDVNGNRILTLAERFPTEQLPSLYPFFITFDFECTLVRVEEKHKNTLFSQVHIPASVAFFERGNTHFLCAADYPSTRAFVKDFLKQVHTIAEEMVQEAYRIYLPLMRAMWKNVDRYFEGCAGNVWKKCEEAQTDFKVPAVMRSFLRWLNKVPIVGFNSSFYDLGVIIGYGLLDNLDLIRNSLKIKKGMRYQAFTYGCLSFLDILLLCAPGTSLASYMRGWSGVESKGTFPYEWFDSLDKLKQDHLPEGEWFSSLKQSNLKDSAAEEVWKREGCKTMYDYLKWYNIQDVAPFYTAIEKHRELFMRSFQLDILKDGFSVAGLAEKAMVFSSHREAPAKLEVHSVAEAPFILSSTDCLTRISSYKKQDNEAVKLAKEKVEKFNTQLTLNPEKEKSLEEKIELYSKKARDRAGRGEELTVERIKELMHEQGWKCYYCHSILSAETWSCDRINNYYPHTNTNIVMACQECNKARAGRGILEFKSLAKLKALDKVVPQIYLIDEEQKEAFYLLKQITGGPSIIFHRYHEKGITQIQRYHWGTSKAEWKLDPPGKTVEAVYGYDANALYLYVLGRDMLCGRLTVHGGTDELLGQVMKRELFGAFEVDIHVPEELYDKFAEFPPLFVNRILDPKNAGKYMRNYILRTICEGSKPLPE